VKTARPEKPDTQTRPFCPKPNAIECAPNHKITLPREISKNEFRRHSKKISDDPFGTTGLGADV
jgi:hypothetical protein